MRDPLLETSGTVAGFYDREFYCFSNFSSFAVLWREKLWQTSEHAYQAAHFFDTAPEIADEIANSRSAHDAKKIAEREVGRVDPAWHSKSLQIMEEICRAKLAQHPYIKKKLGQTKGMLIVEDSPVDSFWGWGPDRKGRNELGKIWMKLREELG